MEIYKIKNDDLNGNLNETFQIFNTALKNSLNIPFINDSLLTIHKEYTKLFAERTDSLKTIKTIRDSPTKHKEHFVSLELIKIQNKLVKLVLKLVIILHTTLQLKRLKYVSNFHSLYGIQQFILIFSDCIYYTFSKHKAVLLYDEIKKFHSYLTYVDGLQDEHSDRIKFDEHDLHSTLDDILES